MFWMEDQLLAIVLSCFEEHGITDSRPMFQRPCGCYHRYTDVVAAVCDYDPSPSRKLVQGCSEQAPE